MFKPLIDVLYSIAIGIGFTEFPRRPFDNIPGVIFFLVTLVIAIFDWFYYDKFEPTVPERKKFNYYLIQIAMLLVLSQLFQHACEDSLRYWIFYLVIFTSLGILWNIFIGFTDYRLFVSRNITIVALNIVLLIFYHRVVKILSVSERDFRYKVFFLETAFIVITLLLSLTLFRTSKSRFAKPEE